MASANLEWLSLFLYVILAVKVVDLVLQVLRSMLKCSCSYLKVCNTMIDDFALKQTLSTAS